MNPSSPGPLLVIEDDHTDYEMISSAVNELGLGQTVYRIVFGPDALNYLNRKAGHQKHADEPLPSLITLDINLPAIDGMELLRTLRTDERFRGIPVVIVTDEESEVVREECLMLGVSSYVKKGFDQRWLRELTQTIRSLLVR